jgi:heme A synthase
MRELRSILTIAAALLFGQIALGAFTVITELPSLLVGSHLTVGMLFLCLAVIGAVQVQNRTLSVHGLPRWRGIAALLGALLVVVSGALVVGMAAGVACQGYLSCNGGSGFSRMLVEVHMGHRYGAYIFSITVALLAGWRLRVDHGRTRWLGILAIALLAVQITLGFAQVRMGLPQYLRVGHVFTASLIMATATALYFWPLGQQVAKTVPTKANRSARVDVTAPDPA